MFIFFDGEEAFEEWGPNDSIYGAKHLANQWHNNKTAYGEGMYFSELDKMVYIVLHCQYRNIKINIFLLSCTCYNCLTFV